MGFERQVAVGVGLVDAHGADDDVVVVVELLINANAYVVRLYGDNLAGELFLHVARESDEGILSDGVAHGASVGMTPSFLAAALRVANSPAIDAISEEARSTSVISGSMTYSVP